jgi:predicted anti-sigma-YlaC factor YlaD
MAGDAQIAACLTDDQLAGFVADELAPDLYLGLVDHLDACARCRRLVSALARLDEDAAPRRFRATDRPTVEPRASLVASRRRS